MVIFIFILPEFKAFKSAIAGRLHTPDGVDERGEKKTAYCCFKYRGLGFERQGTKSGSQSHLPP